ncbi:NAD(P)-binding domain-containing protein [Streptomyces sp. SS7]|uniref:NAD(P)-binding domain-containing protein n=1 Tax=Streptomyces sp. SS7 TaxID=3108485 RepID=UPI0030EC123C
MRISVIDAGAIGGNLARKLGEAGHDVEVADARGRGAVAPEVLTTGARAVPLDDAVKDREAVILAVPFNRLRPVRPGRAASDRGGCCRGQGRSRPHVCRA